MSNDAAVEAPGAGAAADASGFYLVEVRRTPGAAGYRAAARAVEALETTRFVSLAELCRFLRAAAGMLDDVADDSSGAAAGSAP